MINKYLFCFKPRFGYSTNNEIKLVKNNFKIKIKNKVLKVKAFDVLHGMIKATGYLFEKLAYISDCHKIPYSSLKIFIILTFLIIDCLKINKHPSHFNLEDALNLVKKIKPKKTILTNLHTDLDYEILKKNLPSNVVPAYDGLSFNF